MLIDWFTVGAQVLNFLILAWLLKRFLYKPILQAIDAREQRIASALADADEQKAEAKRERDDLYRKNEAFDRQRAALLTRAADAAEAERRRLLEAARQESEDLRAKQQEALRTEAQYLNRTLARRTQNEVFAITRKALADLATVSLEERMVEVFTRRLQAMDGPAQAVLAEAFKTASEPALVRSAFDLPAAERAAIQQALIATFPAAMRVRFETAPDLVGGIELSANGQKLAWSIADYLASLEKGIDEVLQEKGTPETKPKPEA